MTERWKPIVFVAIAGVAFLTSVVAALSSDLLEARSSVQADVDSVSALGHRAFIDWVETRGHPVMIARALQTRRAAEEQPLLMLEPRPDARSALHAAEIKNRTAPTLLVLPKRTGVRDDARSEWVGAVSFVAARPVEEMLAACGIGGEVVRDESKGGVATAESGIYGHVTLSIANPQVLKDSALEPLIETDAGVLFGRTTDNRPIYVLADPDVLENHGIGAPGRIEFLAAIVDELALDGEPIVVDETVHGSGVERSFWREAIQMPLLPATLGTLLTILVVGLGSRRFGRPEKSGGGLAPGKRVLIDSMAELQRVHGASHAMLKRYRAIIEHDVLRALGYPDKKDDAERHALLARRGREVGSKLDLDLWLAPFEKVRLRGRSGERRLQDAIVELRRWQKEITSGSTVD